MNKYLPVLVIAGLLVSSIIVYFFVQFVSAHHLYKANEPKVVSCVGRHPTHMVLVQNNAMVPKHTNANLCDELAIINKDAVPKLIAFGAHDNHVPYDNVAEKLLQQDQKLTITLNQPGTYQFHDHIADIAQGEFTVANHVSP